MAHGLIDRRLAVAPMMQRTDRHCRYFLRLISRHTLLYTEMITTGAILHNPPERRAALLAFDPSERPLALQLGGNDPEELAECARIGADLGYDEINLNLGCPSDAAQSARFGACLMAEPDRVAECVAAMGAAIRIPITVKCRTGIDDLDSYDYLAGFVAKLARAGCSTFIVHARKAWLTGLNPKENRTLPPLHYDWVYRLKREHPQLTIIINGGIVSLADARAHLQHVNGVMIGRAAYDNPYLLADADRLIFGACDCPPTRHEVLARFAEYAGRRLREGVPLSLMTRHILGLFQGQAGARAFRRALSELAPAAADAGIILAAARRLAPGAALERNANLPAG